MGWVEVFVVFIVCHLTGDYLLQTDWQARNKRGGLASQGVARRALLSHTATYTLAFVPALIWMTDELAAGVLAVATLIAIPHLMQDDGRLLAAYMTRVKGVDRPTNLSVAAAVDQTFHVLALFLVAVVVGD